MDTILVQKQKCLLSILVADPCEGTRQYFHHQTITPNAIKLCLLTSARKFIFTREMYRHLVVGWMDPAV